MKGKILVIDDDDQVRESLSLFLDEMGYDVTDTCNGTQALPLIRGNKPDLVLCDLVMPQLSGLMILRQIRVEFPEQKVIIMSGLQEGQPSEEAMKLGAFAFVNKPISMEDLQSILGKALK